MIVRESVAVVTGAGSGLGAATAAALAAEGARVFGLDSDAASMGEDAEGVTLVSCDVTRSSEVVQALDRACEAGPLRVVVNCAGVALSRRLIDRTGPHAIDAFEAALQVNLVGTFSVMTLAAQRMAQLDPMPSSERGVVVNTASVAAFEGQVGQVAYSASKAGVAGMTLPAARDLADHGIRVNAIAPGIVDTPMLASVSEFFKGRLAGGVPFPKRVGRPSEFADLVLFLVRNEYVNGEVIRLDGGLRMTPR
ncbi:SDR family NAD(P)-dependent oxidoreductase [Nocardioides sp.]|uniref:SDR family NAD(P)-dependent oxidoreductase n=1 Tax=Nocardioides sp. TaxID=35761 RepID=UPI0037847590